MWKSDQAKPSPVVKRPTRQLSKTNIALAEVAQTGCSLETAADQVNLYSHMTELVTALIT